MFKTKTVVVVFCAALGFSQGGRIPLTGRVEGDTRDIYVELREQGNRLIVEREMVAHDGTFHLGVATLERRTKGSESAS